MGERQIFNKKKADLDTDVEYNCFNIDKCQFPPAANFVVPPVSMHIVNLI